MTRILSMGCFHFFYPKLDISNFIIALCIRTKIPSTNGCMHNHHYMSLGCVEWSHTCCNENRYQWWSWDDIIRIIIWLWWIYTNTWCNVILHRYDCHYHPNCSFYYYWRLPGLTRAYVISLMYDCHFGTTIFSVFKFEWSFPDLIIKATMCYKMYYFVIIWLKLTLYVLNFSEGT